MAKKRIALLTGGGDAPGLNAVISTLTRACLNQTDYEIIGYKFGYRGLYENNFIELTRATTSGILHRGGTILYSSNKDNLFDYQVVEDGKTVKKDVSDVAVSNMKKENVEVLVVLGGDGTLTSARDFARKGVNVIGVPKTIDNDLGATSVTFGFDTAVNVVTESLGRIHTTAEAHQRVMIVEVMGRNSGWISLFSGVAGSADVILLPEFPYNLDRIAEKIKSRNEQGSPFTVIVIGEGAREEGKEVSVNEVVDDSPDPIRLGGIGAKLAHDLKPLVPNEVRSLALGHLQRGGETSPRDRVLSARYGNAAAQAIIDKDFGKMVALEGDTMVRVSLEDVIGNNKYVEKNNELITIAKRMGISFANDILDK